MNFSPLIRKIILDLTWEYIHDPSKAPKGRKVRRTKSGAWQYETIPRPNSSSKILTFESYDPLYATPEQCENIPNKINFGGLSFPLKYIPDLGGREAQGGSGKVDISDKFFDLHPEGREFTLMHEIGHTWAFRLPDGEHLKMQGIGEESPFGQWQKEYIYGEPTADEAMATGFAAYHLNPDELKTRYPAAYEYIKNHPLS